MFFSDFLFYDTIQNELMATLKFGILSVAIPKKRFFCAGANGKLFVIVAFQI
jgi:hypothetical protein